MNKAIISSRIPSSRFERTAGFGSLALKIGANLAKSAIREIGRGQAPSLRSMMLSHKNFEEIADSLAHMRGAAMKLGQLMSMDDTDLLPSEFVAMLTRLRASGYAMPPKQLRLVLDKNWGLDWRRKFSSFSVRPFAAASIGQVHKAVLNDGRKVAVKVQFPNIKNSIKSDVSNLRLMARASGMLPKAFDFEYYLKICQEQLIAETDYLREAKYIRIFGDFAQSEMCISVPTVVMDFSTNEILTMSFEEGIEFDSMDDFAELEREHIAVLLVTWTIREIFEFHLIQTDPNFANFRYDPHEGKLKLLDFGATVVLPRPVLRAYEKLIQNVLKNDKDGVFRALVEEKLMPEELPNGISGLLDTALSIGLSELHENVFFSFADSKVFDLINSGTIQEFAQVVPPSLISAELLLVQRKLIGLFFLLRKLGVTLPLKQILEHQLKIMTRS